MQMVDERREAAIITSEMNNGNWGAAHAQIMNDVRFGHPGIVNAVNMQEAAMGSPLRVGTVPVPGLPGAFDVVETGCPQGYVGAGGVEIFGFLRGHRGGVGVNIGVPGLDIEIGGGGGHRPIVPPWHKR
jgi:hypothetical protein